MPQLGDRLRLALESIEHFARGKQVVAQRLDGDLELEATIPDGVHRAEAAATD